MSQPAESCRDLAQFMPCCRALDGSWHQRRCPDIRCRCGDEGDDGHVAAVLLQTPHAQMPDLHLSRNEIDDLRPTFSVCGADDVVCAIAQCDTGRFKGAARRVEHQVHILRIRSKRR